MEHLEELIQRAAHALEFETEFQVEQRLTKSNVDPDSAFLAIQAGKILTKDQLLGEWGW